MLTILPHALYGARRATKALTPATSASEPFEFLGVGILALLAFPADVGYHVLEYSERADHGAINPSEEDGQHQEADYDRHVEGEDGR